MKVFVAGKIMERPRFFLGYNGNIWKYTGIPIFGEVVKRENRHRKPWYPYGFTCFYHLWGSPEDFPDFSGKPID
jgi:hypothetical protein